MKAFVEFSAVCGNGKIRKSNQDKIYINGEKGCSVGGIFLANGIATDKKLRFAVFDGMGGELCGEKASEIAVKTIEKYKNNINISLKEICFIINDKICDYMTKNNISRMGSTLAMIEISPQRIALCNIGDSKVLALSNEKMTQISIDHTLIVDKKQDRRVLTQHLGIPKEEMVIEPYCVEIPVKKDDLFLICSDGLTDMVAIDEISQIISNHSIQSSAEMLYNEAVINGGKDNISAIVIRIEENE